MGVERVEHTTSIKTKEYQYVWQTVNVQYAPKPKGHSVFSSDFSSGGATWDLRIFPRGLEDDAGNCISVGLYVRCSDTSKFKNTFVEVSVIDENGELVNPRRKLVTKEHLEKSTLIAFNDYIARDKLHEYQLPGNELTLLCKLLQHESVEQIESSEVSQIAPAAVAVVDDAAVILPAPPIDRRIVEFDDFEKLLENEHLSDFELVVTAFFVSKSFHVHRAVLAARSPVFAKIIERAAQKDESKLQVTGVEAEIMREVLRFVYAGKVSDIEKSASKILPVAEKYQLGGLIAACEKALAKQLHLFSVADALVLIDKCPSAKELKAATFDFLTKNGKEFKDMCFFKRTLKSLKPELLAEVINAVLSKL